MLENGQVLTAIIANILALTASKSANEKMTEAELRAGLEKISHDYGLEPSEVDRAIRNWSQKTQDPYEKGLAEFYAKNYKEATQELSKSLRMRESQLEKAQAKVVDAAFFLGESLYQQGRYREAADASRKAAVLRKDDGAILTQLGLALSLAGDPVGAEPILQQALAILEKALGQEHLDVATALNNVASVYLHEEKYREAEPLYKRALAIREKVLGPGHTDVAVSLDNLASLYQHLGEYREAEPLHKRALAIFEKALGSEHQDVAVSMSNLARLYRLQGRYGEAEPLYKRALAIFEKVVGPNHPYFALGLEGLGMLYYDQGRYNDAEPLYTRALVIQEQVLGPEHPDLAKSLNNLASLYRDQGKYKEAETLYRRALAICEKTLGFNAPLTKAIQANLSQLLEKLGRP